MYICLRGREKEIQSEGRVRGIKSFPPYQEAKCNLRVVEDVSRLIENATRKRDEQDKNQIVPVPASSNKKSRRIKSSLQWSEWLRTKDESSSPFLLKYMLETCAIIILLLVSSWLLLALYSDRQRYLSTTQKACWWRNEIRVDDEGDSHSFYIIWTAWNHQPPCRNVIPVTLTAPDRPCFLLIIISTLMDARGRRRVKCK